MLIVFCARKLKYDISSYNMIPYKVMSYFYMFCMRVLDKVFRKTNCIGVITLYEYMIKFKFIVL